jgi:hypothetical protein
MYLLLIAISLFVILILIGRYIEPFYSNKCKKQEDCPDDKYCDVSMNACIKKLNLENTCLNDYQCIYGKCEPSTSRCTKIKTEDKCQNNLDCISGICDGSLHCL